MQSRGHGIGPSAGVVVMILSALQLSCSGSNELQQCRTRVNALEERIRLSPITGYSAEAALEEGDETDAARPLPEAAGVGAIERPQQTSLDQLYAEALENPHDKEKLWVLANALPKEDGRVVLEGDLVLSVDELQALLTAQLPNPPEALTQLSPGNKLAVMRWRGMPSYWKTRAERRLTYAIDKASFPNPSEYAAVVGNFRAACAEWEQSCPRCKITFIHQDSVDTRSDLVPGNDIRFVVRYRRDPNATYVARAFFPHWPVEWRYVDVSPKYFTTGFDRVGVFRHEVGHILGYRHEHTRVRTGSPRCKYEDGEWLALGEYDARSVMHYPCVGRGSSTFEITENDRIAHERLYAYGRWEEPEFGR